MPNTDNYAPLAADMVTRYGRAAGEILRRRADESRRAGDALAAATRDGAAALADRLCQGAILT
jgi:hypothetical protein